MLVRYHSWAKPLWSALASPSDSGRESLPCAHRHRATLLSGAPVGVSADLRQCPCGRWPDGWPAHLLFLGGGEEAHHLHGLLEPFKVMLQVFSIFDLQVMLKHKVSETPGISGSERVACGNDFGWSRWGRAQDMGNEWAPLCCLLWASWSRFGGWKGPRQTASDLLAERKQPVGNRGGICG